MQKNLAKLKFDYLLDSLYTCIIFWINEEKCRCIEVCTAHVQFTLLPCMCTPKNLTSQQPLQTLN